MSAKEHKIATSGTTLRVAKGDIVVFERPENRTTGFQWVFKMGTRGGLTAVSDEYQRPKGMLLGAGGTRIVKWKVQQSTKINFAQRAASGAMPELAAMESVEIVVV